MDISPKSELDLSPAMKGLEAGSQTFQKILQWL